MMIPILLIEDDPQYSTLLASALAPSGFDVMVKATAQSGFDTALDEIPALIVIDLALPGVDGVELIRALRQEVAVQHIPIVVTTALADAERERRAWEAGCDAFLTKPFRIQRLVEAMQALLTI